MMESDMSTWTDLLHSSTKILEQAAPSAHFPPLQRNLDQLESLSKKLKDKARRTESPTTSAASTRLLAREGLNAEQLARDLRSFELKTTFEDVFPAEATSIEEYLQQVHEMAMISAIQEAQKDNLRSFNEYMMHVLEDNWQREKRDFLQSICRLSTLPKIGTTHSAGTMKASHMAPPDSRPHSSLFPDVEIPPLASKPVSGRKAQVYGTVVRSLNEAREHGLPFKPATAFKVAYENLGLDSSVGKSVNMLKMWHLVQSLVHEELDYPRNISKKMSLVLGARQHLEWGHERYILDIIQSHPAQAALGGAVGNLQKVRAFLRIRLRDHGMLDFDSNDTRSRPPVDTTWQQIYFCLRTGYYEEAQYVAQSSRVSHQFAPKLAEWIATGGMISEESAIAASGECDKMLRMGDRVGRTMYDKKRLLLYAIISGSRRLIDRMLADLRTHFTTIEDFLWFKLAAVRDYPCSPASLVLKDGWIPYTLDDLHIYLNKFEPSYYTNNGKDPLLYPYVLLLSIQLVPAVLYLSKQSGEEGLNIDAVHIAIVFADHGFTSDAIDSVQKFGTLDASAEITTIIHQYGSLYLRSGELFPALEYFAQAAASIGGGRSSWTGQASQDQQRQKDFMLKQLLTEILLRDGGIQILLGSRGYGEEGALKRFLIDSKARHQFLLDAARQCQEAGFSEKSIDIHKRLGAFAMGLDTVNKCLSDAISAFSHGRLDGESRAAALVQTGNEILEMCKYSQEANLYDRDAIIGAQTSLRQLEAILHIHKLAMGAQHMDALRELMKLSFLPLDPRSGDAVTDICQNLSPYVQACIPDVLKLALSCLDVATDSGATICSLRAKIAKLVASNMSQNWPHDLYEKIARSI